jgi:hypothetical protein
MQRSTAAVIAAAHVHRIGVSQHHSTHRYCASHLGQCGVSESRWVLTNTNAPTSQPALGSESLRCVGLVQGGRTLPGRSLKQSACRMRCRRRPHCSKGVGLVILVEMLIAGGGGCADAAFSTGGQVDVHPSESISTSLLVVLLLLPQLLLLRNAPDRVRVRVRAHDRVRAHGRAYVYVQSHCDTVGGGGIEGCSDLLSLPSCTLVAGCRLARCWSVPWCWGRMLRRVNGSRLKPVAVQVVVVVLFDCFGSGCSSR